MVKIRLSRTGRKNYPQYRIVVINSLNKRDGKFIENIGYYNPMVDPIIIKMNKDRYSYWISKGAQLSSGLSKLLKNK